MSQIIAKLQQNVMDENMVLLPKKLFGFFGATRTEPPPNARTEPPPNARVIIIIPGWVMASILVLVDVAGSGCCVV